MGLAFSSIPPWAFQFFRQTEYFLFVLQAFSAAFFLPSASLVLEQRSQIPDNVENFFAFGLHPTQETDAIRISFALLSTTVQNLSLSWPFSKLRASFSPSILISGGKETATTTKIASYFDLKQVARPNSEAHQCLLGPENPCRCQTTNQAVHPVPSPPFLFPSCRLFQAYFPKLPLLLSGRTSLLFTPEYGAPRTF